MARDWKARLKRLSVGAIRNAVRGYRFSRAAGRSKETLVEEASMLEGEWREALETALTHEMGSQAGPSTLGTAARTVEIDEEWKAKLDSLSREQIMDALDTVASHDFTYGARRTKDKLVEEASRLEGELRQALEAAVLEKERITTLRVSLVMQLDKAVANMRNRCRTIEWKRLMYLKWNTMLNG